MKKEYTVGVIGGGVAGSTIAIRLSELGIKTILLEKGESLVNGPPICHIHAGGNLYREISDEQCITLLKESIELVRMYPGSVDYRPTLIAVPTRDEGNPLDLVPRLEKLQTKYEKLIVEDAQNAVLGTPETYYKFYNRKQVEYLANQEQVLSPSTLDEWMIGAAKEMDLDRLKFPLVMVEEYGWNIFRLAAIANLSLDKNEHCKVVVNAEVDKVDKIDSDEGNWKLQYRQKGKEQTVIVDYLVNACGFRTGSIDDMVAVKKKRMVEFKAAYITKWDDYKGDLPEIIFHGIRGTENGMAQLTPYPGGYYQVHGMTTNITLFNQGLKASSENSAQPILDESFLKKIDERWEEEEVEERTKRSIEHIANFVPGFSDAITGGTPFFGAQQIPGDDPELRAASVSFPAANYACCEIVKASSTLAAANAILEQLQKEKHIAAKEYDDYHFPITNSLQEDTIQLKAEALCKERNYPVPMASRIRQEVEV